jgi:hypothetical protein
MFLNAISAYSLFQHRRGHYFNSSVTFELTILSRIFNAAAAVKGVFLRH